MRENARAMRKLPLPSAPRSMTWWAAICARSSPVRPGGELKATLMKANAWSQYLEVGIGPDAEIFTKGPVLSSVGPNMDVGIHPKSSWNNPEPEIVMVVASTGKSSAPLWAMT